MMSEDTIYNSVNSINGDTLPVGKYLLIATLKIKVSWNQFNLR
ncbi:MAG: hypothetical protein ACJAXJ_004367 [Colwellia sp.]|jgi:hypothetical protein